LWSHAKRRSLAVLIACSVLGGQPLAAQLAPPSAGGLVELDRLLHRLAVPYRVLVIGAHPDDEDTSLLALMARGYGAEAAYLSLSRGDGGQNLIGGELGVALGLLRSQELVSARELDGARQFFTRAYDFGYSRSLDETLGFWLPDSVLKDVVRVVRRFRPHVILSVWSGTPRDRHGQHQMSGVVAYQAFTAAADPTRFPELETEEDLEPWRPLKLYRSTRFDTASTTLTLETGGLDPMSGRTYEQIAMASRSQHRSQDMGRVQRTGPAVTRMQLVADLVDREGEPSEAGLFAGIPADTSWLASFADSLRGATTAPRLGEAVPALADALRRTRELQLPAGQVELLERALAVAAGLVVDGTAARSEIVPGASLEVTLQIYNAGTRAVRIDRAWVRAPSGWLVTPVDPAPPALEPGSEARRRFEVTVPQDAEPSQPYFLTRPVVGALYDWSETEPAVRGLPFGPPLLEASVSMALLDAEVRLGREISRRFQDQAVGEVREPLRVVPAIEVALEPDRLVWSSAGPAEHVFTVTLMHRATGSTAGEVRLEADGWKMPPPQSFLFRDQGESQSFSFTVVRPDTERARATVWAVAATESGAEHDLAAVQIRYPHVRPTAYVRSAASDVEIAPIVLPRLGAVGYVRGAADRVPEALSRIGLPLEILDADAVAAADLSRFDAIVVGPRAYETDSALVSHNDRLLEYVRDGGLLIVQYQQYQFVRGGYAPYALEIARPHDRITDEAAPVTLLDPDHPAVTRPNHLGDSDWLGWPQERGLYFAHDWDDAYSPLLELSDPGMSPLRGGLLVASFGDGTYVYTGISFFRALPAGVPGAYRLFLNLLALGE
jgi:LmbE family N-acetylglucosaminyl deacetylase